MIEQKRRIIKMMNLSTNNSIHFINWNTHHNIILFITHDVSFFITFIYICSFIINRPWLSVVTYLVCYVQNETHHILCILLLISCLQHLFNFSPEYLFERLHVSLFGIVIAHMRKSVLFFSIISTQAFKHSFCDCYYTIDSEATK